MVLEPFAGLLKKPNPKVQVNDLLLAWNVSGGFAFLPRNDPKGR
jgi:hypothetical protein